MSGHEAPDPLIDEIHEIRRRILREHGDDPARLVEHWMELQREYTGPRISAPPSTPERSGKSAA